MSENGAAKFISDLGKGREAFHAEVTEFALRSGERTPEDFLRHFSCRAIMKSLDARPTERARIVSQSTGVHEKVAHKMSSDASGESVQIALEEGVTTSAAIVGLFQPDDKQRYLERHALWAFDIEGQPWKATPANKTAHDRAKAYLAYILERALENLLISHEEVVHGITVGKLVQSLPKEKLGIIIEASLKTSDKFTEEDLLAAIPPQSLVEYVPLDYLWEKVIVPLVAEAHDYAPKPVTLTAAKSANGKSSDSGEWLAAASAKTDSASSRSSSTVTEDEIVSEDEILETDEDPLTSPPLPNDGNKA
ncbi:MAG: hypothetical protein ABJB12_04510 [Pseudomonadota bacterium]